MSYAIALSDEQWELVADLFDPPVRRGAPAQIPRRRMVDAMLFIGRTGIQWRYLPERYGPWTAVWSQWRRWRASGVWAAAMTRLVAVVRWFHGREPAPSMVMVDAQTVKGARYGPTFHAAGRSAPSARCWSRSSACRWLLRPARPGRTTWSPPASCCASGSTPCPDSGRSSATAPIAVSPGLPPASASGSTSSAAQGRAWLHPALAAVQGRARNRPARALAAAVPLL